MVESTCNTGDAGTQVQFLGLEDPLEEAVATHSNILAGKILQSVGLQSIGHNLLTEYSTAAQPSHWHISNVFYQTHVVYKSHLYSSLG